MNWYVHSTTALPVGFGEDGKSSEGGNCKHLRKGSVAFGYSGEADEWGEELYLMCKPCYETFLANRRVEPVECNDCQKEFPRNTLFRYIPCFLDGSRSEQEDSKLWVCKDCQGKHRHLQRLENDRLTREQDDEWERQRDDELGPDDGPDDYFPEDAMQEELVAFGNSSYSETVMCWSRELVGKYCHDRPFSKGIQKVVVVDKTYYSR